MQTLRTLISNNIEIWTWSTFTLMGSYIQKTHVKIKPFKKKKKYVYKS